MTEAELDALELTSNDAVDSMADDDVIAMRDSIHSLVTTIRRLRAELAEANERCARIAADERVAAHETNEETDLAYNQACDDIAAAIRGQA